MSPGCVRLVPTHVADDYRSHVVIHRFVAPANGHHMPTQMLDSIVGFCVPMWNGCLELVVCIDDNTEANPHHTSGDGCVAKQLTPHKTAHGAYAQLYCCRVLCN